MNIFLPLYACAPLSWGSLWGSQKVTDPNVTAHILELAGHWDS